MIDDGHIIIPWSKQKWISQIAIVVGKRRMEYRYVEQPTTGRGTTIKISLVPAFGIRHSWSKPVLERGGLTSGGNWNGRANVPSRISTK